MGGGEEWVSGVITQVARGDVFSLGSQKQMAPDLFRDPGPICLVSNRCYSYRATEKG